ncbi:ECF RNA polymerase sigma factor SigK [Nocardia sp. NPDC051832]|uniref:ECF RNA polymerase sigma factor SigK n=1 Tax=Nocardia sp. NPDC051832 TaxID=3155673 RepID=UPI0034127FEB
MADPQSSHTASNDPAHARDLPQLLAAVAAGDRDAFTQLYRRTQSRVFGLALRIVRQYAAAEEVTQEVYLQVWKAAGQYDERLASPLGWIMMLTHRRSIDLVRVEARSSARESAYGFRNLGREHDTVAETVAQRLEEQAIADSLRTLTAVQRETLTLAYYGGYTYPEVAEFLGIPLPTVKSRIRNGLRRLELCLV